MKNTITLIAVFLLIMSSTSLSFSQRNETPTQKKMAQDMAEYMDDVWEAKPEEGYGNLRFLFTKNGEPFAGIISIYGRFGFHAHSTQQYMTSFNPNKNGRWVMEELKPGTYKVTIEGKDEMEGFKWENPTVTVTDGESKLITIELN